MWAIVSFMAHRRTDQEAAADLGRKLSALRDTHQPDKGYERIARELESFYGVSISTEQCRKYHQGLVDPTSAKVEDLRGWTLYYECSPVAIGFVAAQRIRAAFALFSDAGPDGGGSEQGIPTSRCIELRPAA